MAQLADAVERAPRADGVLGTRESEHGVQRLADGGVRLGGTPCARTHAASSFSSLARSLSGRTVTMALASGKNLADHALPILIGEHTDEKDELFFRRRARAARRQRLCVLRVVPAVNDEVRGGGAPAPAVGPACGGESVRDGVGGDIPAPARAASTVSSTVMALRS